MGETCSKSVKQIKGTTNVSIQTQIHMLKKSNTEHNPDTPLSDSDPTYGCDNIDKSQYSLKSLSKTLSKISDSCPISQSHELAGSIINIYNDSSSEEEKIIENYKKSAISYIKNNTSENQLICMGCFIQTNIKTQLFEIISFENMLFLNKQTSNYIHIYFDKDNRTKGLGKLPVNKEVTLIKFNPNRFSNKVEMAISFTQLLTNCVEGIDSIELVRKE